MELQNKFTSHQNGKEHEQPSWYGSKTSCQSDKR